MKPQGFVAIMPYPTNRSKADPPPYPRQLVTIGDHLRKRRIDLVLLQKEVADKLELGAMTICNWEINRTSPQLRFIPRMITSLGYVPYDTQSGTLGNRIVACRRSMGLTQKALARRLGVGPTVLGRRERGEGRPSKKLAPAPSMFLAQALADT